MSALTLIGLFLVAYLAHEAGHVAAALASGWSVLRVAVHPLGGLGFMYEMNGRGDRLALVSAAGPLANGVLLVGALAFLPGLYAFVFCVFNAVLAVVNLLPIPGSDGWQLVCALRSGE